jgi:GNAT superfamily N-acetyltransferase
VPRLELALFCAGNRSQEEVPLASTVEIAPRTEADLPVLFGLAKGAFVDLPGWSDRRVLEVLRRDVTFVAREQGQPAGYVALRRKEGGAIVVEQLFVAPGHERRGIGHRLLAYAEGYAIAERGDRSRSSSSRPTTRPAASTDARASCRWSQSCLNSSSLALTEERTRLRFAIRTRSYRVGCANPVPSWLPFPQTCRLLRPIAPSAK